MSPASSMLSVLMVTLLLSPSGVTSMIRTSSLMMLVKAQNIESEVVLNSCFWSMLNACFIHSTSLLTASRTLKEANPLGSLFSCARLTKTKVAKTGSTWDSSNTWSCMLLLCPTMALTSTSISMFLLGLRGSTMKCRGEAGCTTILSPGNRVSENTTANLMTHSSVVVSVKRRPLFCTSAPSVARRLVSGATVSALPFGLALSWFRLLS
mmetsp:Transcript_41527/g.81440  ORF Transcript_41527/g.81440 Transcript_41527/m.81440 type:complete len:209 (-) Transcript_41527:1133-1759(-)